MDAPMDQPDPDFARRQARAARQRGDLAGALAQLQPLLPGRPGDVGLRVEIAECLRLLGRLAEADSMLHAALALAPDQPWVLGGLGLIARVRGDHAASLRHFEQATAALPDHPALRIERARALLDLGREAEAEAAFTAALALDPADARIHEGLGGIARRRGDLAAARAHFAAAHAANPEAPPAAINAATAAAEAGDPAAGLAILAEALARRPDHPGLLLTQGRIARRAGDLAAARAAFAAVAARPGDAPQRLAALLEAAQIEQEAGERAAAEALLREAQAAAPQDPRPLRRLALLARAGGDPAAALGWLDQARALTPPAAPEHPDLLVETAEALRALGRLEEAAARLAEVLARVPGHAWAIATEGQIARARGEEAAALERFAAAAALAPGNADLRIEQARSLERLGRAAEAAAMYEAVLAAAPHHPRALDGLAWLARGAGDLTRAIALFQAAMEASPADPWPGLTLARTLAEAGEPSRAETVLEAVAARHPGRAEVALLRGTLARLRGDRAGAVLALRAAVAAHPGALEPLLDLAQAELAAGDPAAAEAALRHAEALAGETSPRPHLDLGWLHQQAGRNAAALDSFRRAAGFPGAEVAGRIGAGTALLGLGDLPAALAELDAAPADEPEITAQRVHLLTEAGDWPAARAAGDAGMARHPRHLGLWTRRMRLALRADPIEAQARILAAAPPAPPAEAAVAAELSGWFAANAWAIQEAAAAFHDALRLHPAAVEPHQSLARLALIAMDLPEARRQLSRYAELARGWAALQGRRVHASQHLLGHLLGEFELDRPMAERLAGIAALRPAARRIAPLVAAVRDAPGSTAAALALLVALRQAGSLARAAPAGEARIPARIGQYWHDPAPPTDVAALIAGWRSGNPGAEHRRFDDTTALRWLAERYPKPVAMAFRRAREPAMRADLLRLAFLYAEGGYWADADDRCLAPVAGLAPPGTRFLAYQEEHGTLGNNLLGATPRHPVIGRALGQALLAITRGDEDVVWLATGPGCVTRAFAQTLAADALPIEQALAGCRILDRWEVGGTVAMHLATSHRAGRHWTRTARSAEEAPAG